MISDSFFDHINQHYAVNLPFVVYRKPKESSIKALLQSDNKLHISSDFSESGFVFAPFDDKRQAVLIPSLYSKFLDIEDRLPKLNIPVHNLGTVLKEDEQKHIDLIQKGIDAIKNQKLIKVVLSRSETVGLSEHQPIKIFKRLIQEYPNAFVYCWYHPNIGLWLGATPETLLKIEGNRFKTMSLAGTQVYNGTTDVNWNSKEVEEQQIVTESIVNSLKKVASSVVVSKVATVKAGELLHLKTEISGTFNVEQSSVKQLLHSLHPTPAICGFPKNVAKQFILESENYNREFYTGFLGELNLKQKRGRNTNRRNVENNAYGVVKNSSELFVNLRCMKLKNKEAKLFVGGGITKDSIAELEWQETVNKTKTMKRVIVF